MPSFRVLREYVPLKQGLRHILLSCYVWREYLKMYHCIDVFPLKINFLLADIVEPVVYAVAGSSIFAGIVVRLLFVFRHIEG